MAIAADTPPGSDLPHDYLRHDRLRHDLLTPVSVISARVGMIQRAVRRSDSMTDAERDRLLAAASAIQAAVLAVCAVVDGLDDDHGDPGAGG